MTAAGRARSLDRQTLLPAAGLVVATAIAWIIVVRDHSAMPMRGSWGGGSRFVLMWGAMMAAMMLPSAAPMILLYGTVSRNLRARGDAAIPVWLFAGVYLLLWMLAGIPVYAGYLLVAALATEYEGFQRAQPFVVAAVVAAAGIYQLTEAKRVCLRFCESPLDTLMRRWKAGYIATLRLALSHAAYCIGCCWGLMTILVVAGAMSLPWVIGIAAVVFIEKLVAGGDKVASVIGVLLLLFAAGIAVHPLH